MLCGGSNRQTDLDGALEVTPPDQKAHQVEPINVSFAPEVLKHTQSAPASSNMGTKDVKLIDSSEELLSSSEEDEENTSYRTPKNSPDRSSNPNSPFSEGDSFNTLPSFKIEVSSPLKD